MLCLLAQRKQCRQAAINEARDERNTRIDAAIDEAIARKPKGHDFVIDRDHSGPALARHMNVTGG